MKITIVIGPYFPVPPVLGGAIEKIHLALAEEFSARGHEVTMISRAYEGFPPEEHRANVRHLRVQSWDAPRSRILFRFYDFLYAKRVARILPKSDITITNSLFLPILLPKRLAGKLYVHVARYPKLQLWLYLRVDRIQTVSAFVAEAIKRQTPVLADRIVKISNPLTGPLAVPVPAEQLESSSRKRTILYVGRVAAEKGVHYLVEAFARVAGTTLAGVTLRIVGPHEVQKGGDGVEYLRRLEKLAEPVRDAVVFDGFISDMQQLRKIYEMSDIFVYPSLAEKGESFGLAPLEAMAAGCRVLVSDLDCFREYLEPGRNGRVFDHRHDPVTSLARALTEMVNDPDPIAMREAAVETSSRFQLGSIADLFLDDFARLLKQPGDVNR